MLPHRKSHARRRSRQRESTAVENTPNSPVDTSSPPTLEHPDALFRTPEKLKQPSIETTNYEDLSIDMYTLRDSSARPYIAVNELKYPPDSRGQRFYTSCFRCWCQRVDCERISPHETSCLRCKIEDKDCLFSIIPSDYTGKDQGWMINDEGEHVQAPVKARDLRADLWAEREKSSIVSPSSPILEGTPSSPFSSIANEVPTRTGWFLGRVEPDVMVASDDQTDESAINELEDARYVVTSAVTALFDTHDLWAIVAAAFDDVERSLEQLEADVKRLIERFGKELGLEFLERSPGRAQTLFAAMQKQSLSRHLARWILWPMGSVSYESNAEVSQDCFCTILPIGHQDNDMDRQTYSLCRSQAFSDLKLRLIKLAHEPYERRLSLAMGCTVGGEQGMISPDSIEMVVREISWTPPRLFSCLREVETSSGSSVKRMIENQMEESWDWWPLCPRSFKLRTGLFRVTWTTVRYISWAFISTSMNPVLTMFSLRVHHASSTCLRQICSLFRRYCETHHALSMY